MPQNEQFDRFLRHVRKKVRITVHGLRPSGLYGRFAAPRVLLNSIPKAGTHLLENALEQFPLLRNAGRRTVSCWDSVKPATLDSVQTIGNGAFLNAHLTAHPEIFRMVRDRSIKALFVIRDPRDIAVSHFKYVSGIDKAHWAHRHYMRLKDDDARLLASIEGVKDVKPSIGETLRRFESWLDLQGSLVCRFEDLIGPDGGGSRMQQLRILREIAEFLEIPVSESCILRAADRTFSSRSSTFRQGKTGGWRDYFRTIHIDAFKEVAGVELIRYGYEDNMNW